MRGGGKSLNVDSRERQILSGERFLRTFFRLIQAVKLHQDNSQLLTECVRDFVDAIAQQCTDEVHLTIQITPGRIFLQGEKFLYRRGTVSLIRRILHYFEERGLQGLRFYVAIKDSSLGDILAFARLLNNARQEDDPLAWLVQQLEGGAFPWVEIVHGPDMGPREDGLKRKERAQRTYSYALASVREVSQKITSQKPAGIRKVKRIVQDMVDLLAEDESFLLVMSTIRDYDDYTFTHSVNVGILSLLLGKRLGLSRMSLAELGICGLLHDLGKVEISPEILNKPGKLTDREFEEMQKHPLWSVRQIVRLQPPRDLKVKIFLPVFEHHLKYDLSGYPRTHREKHVSLFGRILAIADVFDAITSPRIYRPTGLSPDRALGVMWDGSGKDFDPILLKVFINMLGVYPVGTLLQLDTEEMGLVMDSPEDSDRSRPLVVLLVADGQGGFKKGKVVNLGERYPHTGSFQRSIIRSLNPSIYGIQPMEFIL